MIQARRLARRSRANPGGMLFQCGVHALHELMFYFGPIRRVMALMRYDIHTTATADVAKLPAGVRFGPDRDAERLPRHAVSPHALDIRHKDEHLS